MKNKDSKIMEKILKLLALGESNPNENEAQSAILKAHELMAEHGIDSLSPGEEDISYSTEACEHKGNRKFRRNLANIIAENFRCRNYTYNGRVTLFGRTNDVRIAKETFEYAYSFAYRESNRLYNDCRRGGINSQGVVNSYAIGFLRGLKEKLDAQSTALMVVTPPDVHDEYATLKEKLGLRSSNIRLTASRTDMMALNRGISDGRTVMNGRRLEAAG
jgi:hypothetical protein